MYLSTRQREGIQKSEYSSEENCAVGLVFNAEKGGLDMMATLHIWHPDIAKSLRQKNVFLAQVLQGVYSFAFGIVALLVASGWAELNHYAVVICAATLALFLTLLFAIASWEWDRKLAYSHSHNQAIHSAFLTWIGLQMVWFIFLGVWLHTKEFGSCCSTTDAQPDDDPASVESIQLMVIYGLCCIFQFLSITFTIEAIYAHVYPEAPFQLESTFDGHHREKDRSPTETSRQASTVAGGPYPSQGNGHNIASR